MKAVNYFLICFPWYIVSEVVLSTAGILTVHIQNLCEPFDLRLILHVFQKPFEGAKRNSKVPWKLLSNFSILSYWRWIKAVYILSKCFCHNISRLILLSLHSIIQHCQTMIQSDGAVKLLKQSYSVVRLSAFLIFM